MNLVTYKLSPIWASVRDVINGDDVPFQIKLKAVLHTKDQDYDLYKILALDYIRDYSTTMMDDCQIKVVIPLGDYIFLVTPNQDNLELTLSTIHLQPVGDAENKEAEIEQVRYKVIFDPANPSFRASDIGTYNQDTLNMADMVTVKFRLIDRNAEPLRVKMVQGVYRGVTAEDLIKTLLLGESQKVLVDGNPAAAGLDLVKPDRQEPNNQITISSGTFICEVPTYIQERALGVYKYDIGTYFQRYKTNPLWFVYPLYDSERFDNDSDRDRLIVYSAPPKIASHIERTYKLDGGILSIVVGSDKLQVDTTPVTQLNSGVGFRFMDPNAFMKKPVQVTENGEAQALRSNLNQEIGFMDRDDGLNYVPIVRDITSNPYQETSKVSARQTAILKVIWENADESHIYPGMPAKYCYMEHDEMIEIKGTVIALHATRSLQGTVSELSMRYAATCIISIATQTDIPLPDFKASKSLGAEE